MDRVCEKSIRCDLFFSFFFLTQVEDSFDDYSDFILHIDCSRNHEKPKIEVFVVWIWKLILKRSEKEWEKSSSFDLRKTNSMTFICHENMWISIPKKCQFLFCFFSTNSHSGITDKQMITNWCFTDPSWRKRNCWHLRNITIFETVAWESSWKQGTMFPLNTKIWSSNILLSLVVLSCYHNDKLNNNKTICSFYLQHQLRFRFWARLGIRPELKTVLYWEWEHTGNIKRSLQISTLMDWVTRSPKISRSRETIKNSASLRSLDEVHCKSNFH